jgi:glycosyltransferase involved in cell wall biosynthesis
MRVVMFSNSFPPEIGGIQEHVAQLAKSLSAEGHEVRIVTARRHKHQPIHDTFAGMEVTRIPQFTLPKTQTAQYLMRATAHVLGLRRRGLADVVHYHTFWPDAYTAFVVNKFLPSIYTCHESRFLLMADAGKFQRRLKMALKPFQGIIAPSTELLEVARQLGVSAAQSMFVPNAVDTETFSPTVERGFVRARYNIPDDCFLILCPRRLVPKNGVNFLVESLSLISRHHAFRLLVVGDGPERENLERLVHELKLQESVVFAGAQPNTELPRFYADADVVAIPSLKEATSIAGLEAMASARAVVATNVGGLPEIIQDHVTGLLVTPRDPSALSAAIETLIEQPELRRQLGEAARLRVEKEFTWNQAARQTELAYERAIALWHGRTVPALATA